MLFKNSLLSQSVCIPCLPCNLDACTPYCNVEGDERIWLRAFDVLKSHNTHTHTHVQHVLLIL
jgi:hypothetical protein